MKPINTKFLYQDIHEEMEWLGKEQRRFKTHKDKGHYYFDKIWNQIELMSREDAYKWLAKLLGLKEEAAHFTKLDNKQCQDAIYYCQQLLNDNRDFDKSFGVEPQTPFYIINELKKCQ